MGRITIKPVHMTWRSRKDGKAPVAIRATHHRVPRYYPVKDGVDTLYLSKKEFKDASVNALDELSQYHIAIIQEAVKAATRELMGRDKPDKGKSVHAMFRDKIQQLHRDGSSYSTLQLYFSALESIVKFVGACATVAEFDNGFIKDYERRMINDGYSPTTVSMYIRCLHASIINSGQEPGFTRKILPRARGRKIALSKEDMVLIMNATPSNDRQRWARDMFVFSYLNGGMNTKDIAMLRWADVKPDRIEFSRAKRRGDRPVVVAHAVTGKTLEIIDRHGVKGGPYVFGVLKGDESEERIRKVTNQFTKQINKHLGILCESIGIRMPVTTYVARHSFATILKRQGVDVALISEQLGDSSVTTTRHYLDSFDIEQKKGIMRHLI